MFSVQKHYSKQTQVPHTFIQKCRVNLNIGCIPKHCNGIFGVVVHYDPIFKLRSANRFYIVCHGKKRVCVRAECLSVEKIAPAAENLTYKHTHSGGIGKFKEIYFLYFCIYNAGDNTGNNTSVYRQTAFSYFKEIYKGTLMKKKVVNSSAYYSENQPVAGKIQI